MFVHRKQPSQPHPPPPPPAPPPHPPVPASPAYPLPKQERSKERLTPSPNPKARRTSFRGELVRRRRSRQRLIGSVPDVNKTVSDDLTTEGARKSSSREEDRKERVKKTTDSAEEEMKKPKEIAEPQKDFPAMEKRKSAEELPAEHRVKSNPDEEDALKKEPKHPQKKPKGGEEPMTEFEEVAVPSRPAVAKGRKKSVEEILHEQQAIISTILPADDVKKEAEPKKNKEKKVKHPTKKKPNDIEETHTDFETVDAPNRPATCKGKKKSAGEKEMLAEQMGKADAAPVVMGAAFVS